jgi:hypothetical protein
MPGYGPMKDRKAFEMAYFGAMWQADTCYFPYMPDKLGKCKLMYLISIVYDYSRMIVGARILLSTMHIIFEKYSNPQ